MLENLKTNVVKFVKDPDTRFVAKQVVIGVSSYLATYVIVGGILVATGAVVGALSKDDSGEVEELPESIEETE